MHANTITRFAHHFWPLLLGPILAIGVYIWTATLLELATAACITAAIATWCVCWWIVEPVPIAVTSLLPIGLLPLTGVLHKNQVAEAVGSPIILLLLGGFILSKAMERNGAHLRIALYLVRLFGGGSDKRLVMGFMFAAALLSMWISNTATTLMLLPVALAVLQRADNPALAMPLLLGIAYAGSVGGMGTPIGTPPNLIFIQIYHEATGLSVGFVEWMRLALPIVIVFLPVMAWWLTRKLSSGSGIHMPAAEPWTQAEKRVLLVFALTALAWITRQAPFGGWSHWLGLPGANDASVALIAVVFLFVIPADKDRALLDWRTATDIPWGMLLLFAGGLCVAKAFTVSGLSALVGESMTAIADWPIWLLLLVICLSVTFFTEATSNTATTTLLMPVLAAAALAADIDPKLLMIPATISASCAFMLPVATAPNTIIYSSERITTKQMAREGFVLNVVGAFIVTFISFMLIGN